MIIKDSDIIAVKNRFSIVGNHPLLIGALKKTLQVSKTDFSVLIRGESGVGKENIAKIIHSYSSRKHQNFITVNCGAIPEGTVDSELFGHEKGSFTGANQSRKGYFEEVDKGTIFLDEIGDLPFESQVRLLRVLESGEYMRVGSSKSQKTDARVIAATNVNLMDAIQKNKFREDLYYRLNTVEIYLPPLRDRKEDIPILFRKFLRDFSEKYFSEEITIEDKALELLTFYHWPGNIRELRNFAERISIFEQNVDLRASTMLDYIQQLKSSSLPVKSVKKEEQESGSKGFSNEKEILYKILFDIKSDLKEVRKVLGDLLKKPENNELLKKYHDTLFENKVNILTSSEMENIGLEDTKKESIESPKVEIISKDNDIDSKNFHESKYQDIEEYENITLKDKEHEMIKSALERNKGKRKLAAKELGISERTLYRKIKDYEL